MSSQEETPDKQKIKISFNSKDSKKDSFTKSEECMKNKETHIAAVGKKRKRKSGGKEADMVQDETMGSLKEEVEKSGNSKKAPPNKREDSHEKNIIHCSAKKHKVDEFE